MIDFNTFSLNTRTKNALSCLHIDFAFQPVFRAKTGELYAYEALMQPADMSFTELLNIYRKRRELHIIELASLFGATQAYYDRGYEVPFFVNSFPSEVFLPEESESFYKAFPESVNQKMIVEIIEYPEIIYMNWNFKKKQILEKGIKIALDNYGAGYNDITTVHIIEPNIIKLDKYMTDGIHKNTNAQYYFKKAIETFHAENIQVLAKGIETKEDYEYICSTDVDLVQGFYLGRPE